MEPRSQKEGEQARATQSVFQLAATASRREVAPFLRAEAVKHLGTRAAGFGKKFESRVRVLFKKGLTDAAIAKALGVNKMTVNRRTKRWRKPKRKR